MQNLFKILLGLALLLFIPQTVFAHGATHVLQQVSGSNVVFVNFNVEKFQSGVPITFNFRLYQISDGRLVPFEKAEVEFLQGNKKLRNFSLNFKEGEEIKAIYGFPREGEYKLKVNFKDKGEVKASGEFPLIVEKGADVEKLNLLEKSGWWIFFVVLFYGFLTERYHVNHKLYQRLKAVAKRLKLPF